ncbi:hypothetical protein E4P41_14180 [Geodermatophilus sp. DF01-2]|uniref:hypothetical protein n=1 Tax=Geodermatophilus sp. DF01-2 TaxID=2559610 RepID=UPI001073E63F|nr:hypothetical protein [Geodermatophilus sp. DF01_2]TFV57731.1 hypothetical protein E4P41_14180 [Geodermatophilus sp. DF01_2]
MRALTVLLPAATFLVGLLIGFGIWGGPDGADGADGVGAADPTAAEPTVVLPGDDQGDVEGRTVTTTVPEECLAAVDEAARSVGLLEEAVAALGDLDVARVREIVEDLQSSSTQVRELGEECRALAEVTIGTTGSAPPS